MNLILRFCCTSIHKKFVGNICHWAVVLSDFSPMFMFQAGRKDRSDALNTAIDRMTKKTRDLRRQVSFLCPHFTHNFCVCGLVSVMNMNWREGVLCIDVNNYTKDISTNA